MWIYGLLRGAEGWIKRDDETREINALFLLKRTFNQYVNALFNILYTAPTGKRHLLRCLNVGHHK